MSTAAIDARVFGLAALAAIGQISLLAFQPAMPALEAEFPLPRFAAWSFAVFLVGFAGGQLALGILSDIVGRRSVGTIGLIVVAAASIWCAVASSPGEFFVARFIQGVAAAAGLIVARAGARDIYQPPALLRAYAVITLAMAIVPGLLPLISTWIINGYGWRATLWALSAVAVLLAGVAALVLQGKPSASIDIRSIRPLFREVWATPGFLPAMVGLSAISGAIYAWFAGSPELLLRELQIGQFSFALVQASAAAGYACGAFAPFFLAGRSRPERLLQLGLLLSIVGTFALASIGVLSLSSAQGVTVVITVTAVGLGLAQSVGTTMVIAPFAQRAGTASAILGVTQMLMGALATSAAAFAGTIGMGIGMAACAAVGFLGMRAKFEKRQTT